MVLFNILHLVFNWSDSLNYVPSWLNHENCIVNVNQWYGVNLMEKSHCVKLVYCSTLVLTESIQQYSQILLYSNQCILTSLSFYQIRTLLLYSHLGKLVAASMCSDCWLYWTWVILFSGYVEDMTCVGHTNFSITKIHCNWRFNTIGTHYCKWRFNVIYVHCN